MFCQEEVLSGSHRGRESVPEERRLGLRWTLQCSQRTEGSQSSHVEILQGYGWSGKFRRGAGGTGVRRQEEKGFKENEKEQAEKGSRERGVLRM